MLRLPHVAMDPRRTGQWLAARLDRATVIALRDALDEALAQIRCDADGA